MKILLSVGIYLCLIVVLGYVLAWMAPRERYHDDLGDDLG
jgi:hypothetical protein